MAPYYDKAEKRHESDSEKRKRSKRDDDRRGQIAAERRRSQRISMKDLKRLESDD